MSDLAEKPVEPVSAHQLEQKTNGDAEKPGENGAPGAVKEDKKGDGADERRERNGDDGGRKRRGSFNNDRRGGGFDKRGRGGGRGRGGRGGNNHRGGKNMNRSRFEDLPESDDQAEIRRQVEFYFSDSNLPVDAYLLKLTGGKDNKPVPLKTIHDFKRMRHFQPYSAVREAVAGSEFLDLNEHDEITRKTALADKFTDDVNENKAIAQTTSMARSAYVKGFPEEKESTQLDLESFFDAYNVKAVRLRRAEDGYFKGSVFIEFESEEDQQNFVGSEQKLEFDGKALQVMSKQAYVDKKSQDIRDGKVKPRSPTRYGSQKHHSYDRKGDRGDKDDWNKRRDRDNERDSRGRGRGRGGRGGRGGRRDDRDRSRSTSPNDRFGRSRRSEKDEDKRGDASELLDRAEAEAARNAKKSESEKIEDAVKAGAEAATTGESKKRAREDENEAEAEKGEAKKVKEDAEKTEA